ncbi:glycosyltransferase family 4 protein [Verrucomicrobium sp. BvORR034]|uniref:glycosyltransferase family 4 protein n=1 Tax=Verrucomicrobium sp. BvORR034 TaxID=1396418 RepID=UPI000AD698A4|nr:glycosyltransferase family 4 protein [Verrucomicrobium sp. BvORR034]
MAGYPWGGSEELWSQAALHLKRKGHDVVASVATWHPVPAPVVALEQQGVQIKARPEMASNLLAKIAARLRRQHYCRQLLNGKPDLIVVSQGNNSDGLEWMELCMQQAAPFVSIVQANSESFWPDDQLAARLAKAYASASRVVCVSQQNLDLLENQIGCDLPNGLVIQNPCKLADLDTLPWPPDNDGLHFACVGRLDPAAKGQDILLTILASPPWRSRTVHLNFYGSGRSGNSLKSMAKRLGLSNVTFQGHSENVAQIWRDHHLALMPSRLEGTPLALIEAMWCGRPAVVTDVGGSSSLCIEGETGFLATAPVPELFAAAMERAWSSQALLQAMGNAARRRVEHLRPQDSAINLSDLLEVCISQTQSFSKPLPA